MLDAVSMFSDELMEAVLEERPTPELIREAVRRGTLKLDLTPVFIGSAYKNKGGPAAARRGDALSSDPTEVENVALDLAKEEAPVVLKADPDEPMVALAFKLEEGRFGQLTYLRIYQGKIQKGDSIVNSRTGRDVRVGRLVRMHADEMADIVQAETGDIVALFGVDCASGDTFTADTVRYAMTSMYVPPPVIHLTVKPKDKKAQANMGKALQRFTKEDPTFHARVDEESGETVISGMGELHLDVYVERMKREYNAEVDTGAPQVAYREAITRKAEFNYLHKKQTGGSGQYGKVGGYVEPYPEGEFEFVNDIFGGSIPSEFIPSVEKGFRSMLKKGRLIGFPLTNFRVVINDGAAHAVDSSDNAFQAAARGAFRDVYDRAKPAILEPIMKVADRGADRIPGRLRPYNHAAARSHRRHDRARRVRAGRCRRAAGRDVRVLDRPPVFVAGEGGVHDGVRAVRTGAGRSLAGADQEVRYGREDGRGVGGHPCS